MYIYNISINVFLHSFFTCCRVSLISNKKPDREVIQSFTQPTFRITNLKPNTTYNIAISANNSHGRSRPHELVAQTDEGIFQSNLQTVYCYGIKNRLCCTLCNISFLSFHSIIPQYKPADVTTLSFNNWISYNLSTTTTKNEKKVLNKGSNKKSNIAKIDDDNEHQNPIKLLPIVGKPCHRFYDTC